MSLKYDSPFDLPSQKLKVEMFAGQQLLQSVVSEALQLLESGPSGDR